MIDLDHLIDEANDLTPLSATALRLSRLLSEDDYRLDEMVEAISFDQSLTLKLLRAANSAANGRAQSVGTVAEAFHRIGAAQIVAFTIAANVKSFFSDAIPAYNLLEGELWRHSVAAATCVEIIKSSTDIPVPPEAFTAALLHDVGKLVLGRHLGKDIVRFLDAAKTTDHLRLNEAESLLLGVEHAELGGLIAQHWNLPTPVVLGITYHHEPAKGFHAICDIVHTADLLAKTVEASTENMGKDFAIQPLVGERLGLTPDMLSSLCSQVTRRFTIIQSRYNSA